MDLTKEMFDLIELALAAVGGAAISCFITVKVVSKKHSQRSGKNSKQQISGDNSNQTQNN